MYVLQQEGSGFKSTSLLWPSCVVFVRSPCLCVGSLQIILRFIPGTYRLDSFTTPNRFTEILEENCYISSKTCPVSPIVPKEF